VLTQIAKAAPANTAVSAIEFGANEVRLKPINADSAKLQSLQSQLAAQGWNLRVDGGSWVLKLVGSP
jgi:ActR/RegA family two-component response regulator